MGIWDNYLNFLPGLWLLYSVPWLAGADVRLLTVAATSALAVLLGVETFRRLRGSTNVRPLLTAVAPALALIAIYYLSAFRDFLAYSHVASYWLLLATWAVAWRGRMHVVAGVLFGLCAASRPTMAVAAPILLIFFLRCASRRDAVRFIVPAAVSFFAVMLPFLVIDARATLYGIAGAYTEILLREVAADPTQAQGFALTGFLHAGGVLERYLAFAAIAQVPIWWLAWRRMRDETDALQFVALALLAFAFFAIVPFFYIFVPPLLLLTLSLPARCVDASISARLQVGTVACVFFGLFGVLLAATWFAPVKQIPEMAREGGFMLLDSRKALGGQQDLGWEDNSGATASILHDPDSFFGIPLHDRRAEALYIHVQSHHDEPMPLYLFVNGVEEKHIELQPGARETYRVPIASARLYRGTNRVRVHWPDYSAEHARAESVAVYSIRFGG